MEQVRSGLEEHGPEAFARDTTETHQFMSSCLTWWRRRLDVYLACMRSIQGFTHRRLLADASEVFRAVSYAVASQQPTVVDSVKDVSGGGAQAGGQT